MKFWLRLLAPFLASCAMISTSSVSWDNLSSLGGISISNPYNLNGTWYLPVGCDVSGLNSYSTKSVTINSGIVWAKTEAKVRGSEIIISIVTRLAESANASSKCGDANLGEITEGNYDVFYSGRDHEKVLLGHVTALL